MRCDGRIDSIVDPAGNEITYGYSTQGDLLAVRGNDLNQLRIVSSIDAAREKSEGIFAVVNSRSVTLVIHRHKTSKGYGQLVRELGSDLAADVREFVAAARGGDTIRYLFERVPGEPLRDGTLLTTLRTILKEPKLTTNWVRRVTSANAIVCGNRLHIA